MNSLLEELNCETVFTIPVFGGIGVSEAVVVTWIIMAVLVVLCLCLVRNLKVENPGKKQLMLETAVSGLYNFFEEIVGEKGRRYIPYLSTVAIYIGIANLIGLFGFKPPTKALNVTAALAVMSIILVEYSGILSFPGFNGKSDDTFEALQPVFKVIKTKERLYSVRIRTGYCIDVLFLFLFYKNTL